MAVEPYQLDGLAEDAELARRYGHGVRLLDRDEVRAEVRLADVPRRACWTATGWRMLDPARLAWGLRRACLDLGVRIHEHTRVTGLRATAGARAAGVADRTRRARCARRRVVLATNAFPPLLRRLRARTSCRSTTTR